MAFLEGLLIRPADIHGPAHVDFVEGRQHGGVLFGRQKVLGNPFADRGHGHPAFAVGISGRLRRSCRRSGCGRGRPGFQEENDIAFGDAAARACSLD